MQAYAKTHGGTMPAAAWSSGSSTARPPTWARRADEQGAGLVNALKAVRLAESVNGASPQGSTLLVDKTGLNATVNAGQSTRSDRGHQRGQLLQTVTPTVSGNPTTVSTDTGTVALSSSSPTSVGPAGETDSFETHKFTVRPGPIT